MHISIIGLGYVGFPLALQAASKGHKVTGVDKKDSILESLRAGKPHIREDFIDSLFEKVQIEVQKDIPDSDTYIICVPTPVDGSHTPDLSLVQKATEEVAAILQDGQLVVVESTIYPGVCEEIVKPILDKTGKKYLLAHCPERINPGDPKWHVDNIPRVVGGIDEESTVRATELYESIIDASVTPVSQIKAAEATKILENTFRDVNIAFINEMAQSFYRMGIDIMEVIKGSATKPFSFMPHYPGCGVGGHCIAVDPYYMIQKGKASGFDHDFLIQARRINSNMPIYTIKLIQNTLNEIKLPINGTRIALLGLSYKANVADDRESPSYELIKRLRNKGADLVVYDPYFPDKSDAADLQEALKDTGCVVLATAHKEFIDTSLYRNAKAIIDGRNCLDKDGIRKMGVLYRGIGIRD